MSRIRSQLEAIRRNTAQSGPNRDAYEPAPRPVARQGGYNEAPRNPVPPSHNAEMDRIRQQLDQLTGAIGTLARSQQQKMQEMARPVATPPRQPVHAPQPPAEDRNAAAALARIELLQREMADVKHMLAQMASQGSGQEMADVRHMLSQMAGRDGRQELAEVKHMLAQVAGRDGRQELADVKHMLAQLAGRDGRQELADVKHMLAQMAGYDGRQELAEVKHMLAQLAGNDSEEHVAAELRRVAEGIARLQDDTASRFDPAPHLDEVASDLHQIRDAVIALAEERQNFNPDSLARSIEEGYARIAGQLDTALQRDGDRDGADELAALAGQLGQLRDLVENLPHQIPIDSLSARLEEIAESVIRMDSDKTLSHNFQAMEERLDEITRALVTISVNPVTSGASDGLERIEARLATLSRSIEELAAKGEAAPADGGYSSPVLDHIMMQLGDLSGRLDTANQIDPAQWVDPVLSRLEEMGSRMDALGVASAEGEDSRLRSIEDQIAAIASFIEQSSQPQQHYQPVTDDRLAALEDALGAISSRLQTVTAEGVDFSPIAGRLDSIEQHFAAARDMARDAASQAAQRAVELAGIAPSAPVAGESMFDMLAERLDGFEQHFAQARDMARDAASQAAQRAVELAGIAPSAPVAGESVLDLLAERLEGIEQQLAISRDMAMDAAAQAAERAFQLAGQMQPAPVEDNAGREAQLVDHFSRELQNLDAQARELASRSDDSFDNIRQALQSISQRLEGIEDDIKRATAEPYEAPPLAHEPYEMRQPAPSYRAPAMDMVRQFEPQPQAMFEQQPVASMETPMPSVEPFSPEPEMEDIPLEPGSGVPDLAALVRDASKRRRANSESKEELPGGAQDFLAAARRAAQAAAQDTATKPVVQEKAPGKSSRFALPAILKGKSKLLIGASAAVILLAAALPIASQFSGGGAADEAAIEAPAGTQETAQAPAQAEAGGRPVRDDNAQIEASAAGTPDTPLVQPVDPAQSAAATAPADFEAEAAVVVPKFPDEIDNVALRQAVEDGDPVAYFEIARRYTDGDGIERNLEVAAVWYEAAARAGSAPAQYRLANFLEKGHGVKLDVEKSVMWYQRAAEQGNALAMHNLAVIHTSGLVGGKPDMEAAIGWFEKAAELGVKDSQVNLGIIYAKGIGTQADSEKAYKWLAVAARGGDADAAAKRDTLAAAMRPEQLEKARGEAELWKPQPIDPVANTSEQKPEWKGGAGAAAMLPGSALETATQAVTRELIAKVQEQLAQIGFDPGPPDGQIGSRTTDAVKAFQKQEGLPVDGQITTELLQKLQQRA